MFGYKELLKSKPNMLNYQCFMLTLFSSDSPAPKADLMAEVAEAIFFSSWDEPYIKEQLISKYAKKT